jgi:hypothetical protein
MQFIIKVVPIFPSVGSLNKQQINALKVTRYALVGIRKGSRITRIGTVTSINEVNGNVIIEGDTGLTSTYRQLLGFDTNNCLILTEHSYQKVTNF